ncbi:MAG: phosphoribosylanthranilate isomerase [Steroidobacterales bacterium]
MWLKICGMTSAAAVAAAAAAGADAIGFVFAPSVRRLEPAVAAALAQRARGRVSCIAVTHHPEQKLIDEIMSVFKPDALQTDVDDFERLVLPQGLSRLPVLRAGAPAPAALPTRLLFEGARSGSGELSDWRQAAQLARQVQLILAGGLTVDNVAAAVRAVRPFGLDTSSGVEVQPGIKSPEMIAAFVDTARAALREIAS